MAVRAIDLFLLNLTCILILAPFFAVNQTLQAQSPSVVINEVITDPQQDWNDTEGGNGIPFDEFPGTRNPTTSDEWIELYNRSASPVDLTAGNGWRMEFINGTTSGLDFTDPGVALLRFSQGGSVSNFQPGEYLVIGNPVGSINNDVFIVLTDGEGEIVDEVEIGDDFEGDGEGDGAPFGMGTDGNAGSIEDEAIARFPNATDTGDDINDFIKQPATIGRSNGESAGGTPMIVINEVVADPQQDWSDSEGGNGIPFDAVPGSGSVTTSDEWIELYNAGSTSANLLLGSGFTLEMIDGTPTVLNFAFPGVATLRFSQGGSVLDFQPGEFLIIGNPSGSINNEVYLVLQDQNGATIDDVEIGDDFENDGGGDGAPYGRGTNADASREEQEAIARLPNGSDSDDDVRDFARQNATIGASNGERGPAPRIVAENEVIYFERTHIGGEYDINFLIINGGAADLTVESFEMTGRDPDQWTLTYGLPPFRLGPELRTRLTLCFSPTSAGYKKAILRLHSNDPDRPVLDLTLEGDAFQPPPAANIVINEIVTDPQQDWSDSEGGNGVAFDDTTGTGTISSSDEWIELYNADTIAVDLTTGAGWSLEFFNGTSSMMRIIDPGSAVFRFSAGGSAANFQPGEYFVIGNLPGVVNNSVFIQLSDGFDQPADDVELGDDFEADGIGDGAPDGSNNGGNATGLDDEAIARRPDAIDTGVDTADFVQQRATIGRSNDLVKTKVAPVVRAGADPVTGEAPLTVQFLGVCKNLSGEMNFWWDFGDGRTASARHPVHTFERAGAFMVVLKVIDERKLVSRDSVEVRVTPAMISNVEETTAELPRAFALHRSYPNPFSRGGAAASQSIIFDLPEQAAVELTVHDLAGREVARLVEGMLAAGRHQRHWRAAGLPSGVYFYRLTARAAITGEQINLVRKSIVVR